MAAEDSDHQNIVIINEVQLILSEKRTSLSAMRTGIAVIALPLSVLSLLVATSKLYDITHVLHWMIPLVLICICLTALGAYLILRAIMRIHHYDQLILKLKSRYSAIAEFLD